MTISEKRDERERERSQLEREYETKPREQQYDRVRMKRQSTGG